MKKLTVFQASIAQRVFHLSERSRYGKYSKFCKFFKNFQKKGRKWVFTSKMQKFRPPSRNFGRKIEKKIFDQNSKFKNTCLKPFSAFKNSFCGFCKAFRTFFHAYRMFLGPLLQELRSPENRPFSRFSKKCLFGGKNQ